MKEKNRPNKIWETLRLWAGALGADFWKTVCHWQNLRPLWLAGGFLALSLEIFSVLYFQLFEGREPCEYCVQIRLVMWVIFIGALLAAIKPRFIFLKVIGYVLCLGASLKGLSLAIALEQVSLMAAYNPNWLPVCAPGQAVFPFNLPLEKWIPTHFYPVGICGLDQWSLFGFNMPEWLIIIYLLLSLGLGLMLVSWLWKTFFTPS